MMTACAPNVPAQREPLIVRDARGEQRLSMMRYQETLAQTKASPGAKIEAHAQLGQYFFSLMREQARAGQAVESKHRERALHHFKAATTMWSRHRREINQAKMAHMRGLLAQTYFYQGELASEPLFELDGRSSSSSYSHDRRVNSAFQIAFNYYRKASTMAMEVKDMRRQVAVLTRQGQLFEQVAFLMSDAPNVLRLEQRRQAKQQNILKQAQFHYRQAVSLELSAQDVEGQRWRSIAQGRLCALNPSSCVSQ